MTYKELKYMDFEIILISGHCKTPSLNYERMIKAYGEQGN